MVEWPPQWKRQQPAMTAIFSVSVSLLFLAGGWSPCTPKEVPVPYRGVEVTTLVPLVCMPVVERDERVRDLTVSCHHCHHCHHCHRRRS